LLDQRQLPGVRFELHWRRGIACRRQAREPGARRPQSAC
jgi:hypothetical protein